MNLITFGVFVAVASVTVMDGGRVLAGDARRGISQDPEVQDATGGGIQRSIHKSLLSTGGGIQVTVQPGDTIIRGDDSVYIVDEFGVLQNVTSE